jgi:hypothetical protein
VAVTTSDDTYKIQIWPKAPGYLSGLNLRIDFLDVSCLVFFHHLEADQFRILLCEPFSMEAIKVDLEMDYSTLDHFFTKAKDVKDEFIFESKSVLLRMSDRAAAPLNTDDIHEGILERTFTASKFDRNVSFANRTF